MLCSCRLVVGRASLLPRGLHSDQRPDKTLLVGILAVASLVMILVSIWIRIHNTYAHTT